MPNAVLTIPIAMLFALMAWICGPESAVTALGMLILFAVVILGLASLWRRVSSLLLAGAARRRSSASSLVSVAGAGD